MDSTIMLIIGEAEDEQEKPEKREKEKPEPAETAEPAGPEDAEIEELSNLWTTGNKSEVIRRYMEMDNERSVMLVFAIGRQGSLELAKTVDQALEQSPDTPETTEPESVEPPPRDYSVVHELIGRPHVMPP